MDMQGMSGAYQAKLLQTGNGIIDLVACIEFTEGKTDGRTTRIGIYGL